MHMHTLTSTLRRFFTGLSNDQQRISHFLPRKQEKWYFGPLVIAIFLLCVGVLWYYVTEVRMLVPGIALPSPPKTLSSLERLFSSKGVYFDQYSFWEHFGLSLYRYIFGFVIGAIVGIPLGVISGFWSVVSHIYKPIFVLLYVTPKFLYFVLFVVWFGFGSMPIIISVALVTSMIVSFITKERIEKGNDREQVYSALGLGATPFTALLRVSFPLAIPSVFTGLRLSVQRSLGTLLVAELLLGKGTGFGHLAQVSLITLDSAMGFALIVVTLIVVAVLLGVLRIIEALLSPRIY